MGLCWSRQKEVLRIRNLWFNYQGSYAFSKPTQELFADRWTAIDDLDYQNAVARFQGTKEPNGEAEYAYFRDKQHNYNVKRLYLAESLEHKTFFECDRRKRESAILCNGVFLGRRRLLCIVGK